MIRQRIFSIHKNKGNVIKLRFLEYEHISWKVKSEIDLELLPSDDPRVFYNTLFVDVSENNDSQCHTWKSFEIKYNSATDLLEINGCYVDDYYTIVEFKQDNSIAPTYMLRQSIDKWSIGY